MSHTLIDIAVLLILFGFGIGWTVYRYGKRDRLAFAVVAVVSPVITVFALIVVLLRLCTGQKLQVKPCPDGLQDAERLVEEERQRMFGGELREPMYAKSWHRAYEAELQREAARVQRFAQRVFA